MSRSAHLLGLGQEDPPLIHDAGAGVRAARGDSLVDDGEDVALMRSELPGVSDEKWTAYVRQMISAPLISVSASNGLGMFELMPRRLADLGLVTCLQRSKSEPVEGQKSRTIWVAVFVPPMTPERFLRNPRKQTEAFGLSMRDYDAKMRLGLIRRDPGMSRSGALAILHRAGPNGLDTWRTHERFPATKQVFEKVAGLF